jgi:hypothetical protein
MVQIARNSFLSSFLELGERERHLAAIDDVRP